MTEGTPIYDFMFQATQYSDFIARATEYQLQMDKAPKKYKIVEKDGKRYKELTDEYTEYEEKVTIGILNAFINYDKPQSSIEQYLNDIGLFMFTKFAKRIQHVILKSSIDNPMGVLMFLLGQHYILDTDDIFANRVINGDIEHYPYFLSLLDDGSIDCTDTSNKTATHNCKTAGF